MAEESKPKLHQRIIYVEPNDVYDQETPYDGVGQSLTPKYEDLCISFNLIISYFPRMRNNITSLSNGNAVGDKPSTYSLQWSATRDELEKKQKRVSVLQGDRGTGTIDPQTGKMVYDSDYNYLTTYFTDLTYESYKEKTQIEGLGVESVQISYESWYTPTVTIKFVDLRGSSLFGREEAVHIDEKLIGENVFGAFFTMPYPLFRLQVKGFYGKPVTFQLACSGFKGNFNSETGNFEAVGTFLGYSWSLLTDIPFAYLAAAPYATYLGKEYWERNKGKQEWALWDNENAGGLQPPTLMTLFENIDAAMKREDFGKANEDQSKELSDIADMRKLTNELLEAYANFHQLLSTKVDNSFVQMLDKSTGNMQRLYFSNAESVEVGEDLKKCYETLYTKLEEYQVKNFSYKKEITKDKAPNKWEKGADNKYIPSPLKFIKVFNITSDNQTVSLTNNKGLTAENLTEIQLNEKDGKLSKSNADDLVNDINGDKKIKIKPYCYLVDYYDVENLLRDVQKYTTDREENINKAINESVNIRIIDLLGGVNNGGFKPFIGNVFKVIFCHLETFCHIMFESARLIYDQMGTGGRSARFLNVDINNTDISGVKDSTPITPWPAIYNEGRKGVDCGYQSNLKNVYGWVGDLDGHKFIEEMVVYGLQEGIQQIVAGKANAEKEVKFADFPILPSDFMSGKGVFSSVKFNGVADISGHLADRIAAIIGIMCGNHVEEEMAKTIGRLDAYNLYSRTGSLSVFTELVNPIKTDDSLLEGIMYCDNNYNKYGMKTREGEDNNIHFEFEIVPQIDFVKNNRHPFFQKVEGEKKSLYVHFYDKNHASLVPAVMKDFISYKVTYKNSNGDFEYKGERNSSGEMKCWFYPNIINGENEVKAKEWLHVCDSTKLTFKDDIGTKMKQYYNKYMFSIVTSEPLIKGITNKYNELKNGSINISGYTVKDDLKGFLNNFFDFSNKRYSQWFMDGLLCGNAKKLGLNSMDFLPENGDASPQDFNWIWWDKDGKELAKIDENCEFKVNEEKVEFSDLVIQGFPVYYFKTWINIFGCPFYYLQEKSIKGKKGQVHDERVLKSKAYLFVHTFRYDVKKRSYAFDSNSNSKKNGCIERVPKGWLLLVGAMLWRQRFSEVYGYDPIVNFDLKVETTSITLSNPPINCNFLNEKGYFKIGKGVTDKEVLYTNTIDDYVGKDYNIRNQLIELFEEFALTTFKKISSKYELRCKGTKENAYLLVDTIFEYKEIIKKKKDNSQYTEWKQHLFNVLKDKIQSGLFGSYNAIYCDNEGEGIKKGFDLLFKENNEDQELFKDLYFNSYVLLDNCYKRLGDNPNKNITDNDKVFVDDKLIKAYLRGFKEACNDVVNSQTISVGGDANINMNVSMNTFKNRDLSLAIYYYLKNLWDKWLVTACDDEFKVDKFFKENFIFVDSFYKNVYKELAINCEILYNIWEELADNGSLFHFLSQVVSKHGCVFLPVPDYVGFGNNRPEEDVETMKGLFRPLPYSEMQPPSNSNKFIIMFTHSPSHIKPNQTNFKTDSYDIWSHDGSDNSVGSLDVETDKRFSAASSGHLTDIAARLFSTNAKPDDDSQNDLVTREGYNVPSFGIAFARQNNHIFKNLSLTMDNPVMTEQAIKAQWQIALKGASDVHSVCFIGQDTFNVFSNYSYSITVEMMGNAQICPLMYFQLLNVPLWRGTYMIYKVMHNMTPGNMTTTITAMKMNKFAQPFNTQFFTIHEIPPRPKSLAEKCLDEANGGGSSTTTNGQGYFFGGTITNPVAKESIKIKDPNAYNLVLLRYENTHQRVGEYALEGVIYEYKTNKVLTWTIQSNKHDLVHASQNPWPIIPSNGGWVAQKNKDGTPKGVHLGVSYYCVHITKGKGGPFSDTPGKAPSILTAQGAGNGGCLFHPGKCVGKLSDGNKWTTGCVLCGAKPDNDGTRGTTFNQRDYHKDRIVNTDNLDVKWWKNFYDNVCPKIIEKIPVHLYVVNEYGRHGNVTVTGFQNFNNSASGGGGTPTGKLVNIKESLPAELKDYVIINALYAKNGDWQNFGNRCMPGYRPNQTYLWLGKDTMGRLKDCVEYMSKKQEYKNQYKLMIWDAYRPYAAADNFLTIYKDANGSELSCDQRGNIVNLHFLARVKGTHSGSDHCTGNAIDLTLCDWSGKPLIIPSKYKCKWAKKTGGFDEFSSYASKDNDYIKNDRHFQILKDILGHNGKFNVEGTRSEFWHFTTTGAGIRNETNGNQNYV